jgi:flagellar assembly protein FliH
MSSSSIIKSASQTGIDVPSFNFTVFGPSAELPPEEKSTAGFVKMGLYQGPSLMEDPPEKIEETGPPPLEISEEELAARINAAFNDGLKEGKVLAERGLENVFKALRAATETIRTLREKVVRESEDELLNLIILVARKVIIREVSQDQTILAEVVHNAIARLSAREEITVRINPEDYLLVTSSREGLLHEELISERVLLKPDPTVAGGFCQVDTTMGTLDAGLDAQLDELYRHLLQQRTDVLPETSHLPTG